MTAARSIEQFPSRQDETPELTSVPTGDASAADDAFAYTRMLLQEVIVMDYRESEGASEGKPVITSMPHTYVARGESKWPANGIYSILPLVSIVPAPQE